MNADLTLFVREALARGVARDQIRASLLAARWRPDEIDAALAAWTDGPAGLPVPRRSVSLSAREAFVHLLMFATLYIVAYDTGAMLFVLIEMLVRDTALVGRDASGGLAILRWASAGVITGLPIFLLTARATDRAVLRDPEKRLSGVRRWLTYLTLFLTALVLIGTFVTVVSTALSGELSQRFVLKCVVVFAIAGVVFGHYLGRLRGEEAEAELHARRVSWLGRAGVAGVVISLACALFAAGSPRQARRAGIDERRIDQLARIDRQLRDYHRTYGRLPGSTADLEGLNDADREDPETHERYRYVVTDSLHYRLCASFSGADTLRQGGMPIDREWRHPAGPYCFDREVPVLPPGGAHAGPVAPVRPAR